MSAQGTHGAPSMRTPLGRVRNLGASHSGTTDFWRQRITAVGMTLLIIPVIVIVMMIGRSNQAGAAQILGSLPIATGWFALIGRVSASPKSTARSIAISRIHDQARWIGPGGTTPASGANTSISQRAA